MRKTVLHRKLILLVIIMMIACCLNHFASGRYPSCADAFLFAEAGEALLIPGPALQKKFCSFLQPFAIKFPLVCGPVFTPSFVFLS